MSSFPGQPPKEPTAPEPLRTYTYLDFAARQHTVVAHFVTFTSAHVNFWKRRSDDKQDTLVLSQANTHVNSLMEVTS